MLNRAITAALHVSVVVLGADGAVVLFNAGAERMTGWPADKVEGRSMLGWILDPGQCAEHMRHVLAEGEYVGDLTVRRADGTDLVVRSHTRAEYDSSGRPLAFTGVSVDITETAAARDYLQTVTESIADGLFTVDADGQLIYLNPAGARMLGYEPQTLVGKGIGPAIGAPITPGQGEAVYRRRDGGTLDVSYTVSPLPTGAVVVFQDITERKARERELERQVESLSWAGRIRAALADERFVLHAQPIVDLDGSGPVQHELLLRMVGEDGRLIAPGCFLPTAEETGLIALIDRWVLGKAVELAARGLPVEVNLSASSVGSQTLLADFRAALARAHAPAELIVIELTETAILADEAAAAHFMEELRALGCRIALDDFGTGFGGFTYLKRLPVDYLKIDIEFVRDLVSNPASRHVVEAVVALARGFGQETVAEGVENEETLRLLAELGVDRVQGYHLGAPSPTADLLTLA